MTGRNAASALRLLAPFATAGVNAASGDDLANYDTSLLNNHAMAWGGDVLYQLDLSLSAPAIAPNIAPNSGPGIWVPIIEEAPVPGLTVVETISVADATELAAIPTTDLPADTTAWIGDTFYRLDKTATGTTIAYSDGVALQVDPTTGTGLWVAVHGEAIRRLNFEVNMGSANIIYNLADDNWTEWPTGGGNVISGSPDIGNIFTIGANRVLTYTGPDRDFWVTMYQVLSDSAAANSFAIDLAINGDLIGTNTLTAFSVVQLIDQTVIAGMTVEFYWRHKISLATGDTMQPVISSPSAPASAQILNTSGWMSVTPVIE